jgi:hypothetical protein
MSNFDFVIYAVHVAFWGAFGLTRIVLRVLDRGRTDEPASSPAAAQQKTAPFSRALVALHMVAFGVMYFGVAQAVIPNRVPEWFPGQRLVGAGVIAIGAALMAWALVLREKVDARKLVPLAGQPAGVKGNGLSIGPGGYHQGEIITERRAYEANGRLFIRATVLYQPAQQWFEAKAERRTAALRRVTG